MMELVDVCYAINKSGIYVQFMLPVTTCELEELNSYDGFMRDSIKEDFKILFETYGMEFTTEGSYVIRKNNRNCLVSCIQADHSPELESTLDRLGIEKRDIDWNAREN